MTLPEDRVERASEVASATHPTDPLTAAELAQAVGTLRSVPELSDRARFVEICLREPTRDEVVGSDGTPPPREALAIVLDPVAGHTYEGVVSLAEGRLLAWELVPDVQPAITPEEYAACERTVRRDERMRAAFAEHGVTDPELVTVEAWGIGAFSGDGDEGRRLAWTPCWVRDHPDGNPYARPVEGLYAIVDLNAMEVVRIEDHGIVPLPPPSGDYLPEKVGNLRADLRPLEIVQSEGPSFEVDGWAVTWDHWTFRIGFTVREGLVLHDVAYEDRGRRRSVIRRASCVELLVPYGDPSPGSYRKNAFDIGEYGLGPLTNSLELGCDCLGEIRYFDVDLCNDQGEPYTIRNAICLHEEDAGLLWKHYDAESDHAEVRRSRRLVVSFVVTAGNYDYALYWYLYQDASIEFEVKLTGIVLTNALPEGQRSPFGTLVAPQLLAPNHQHFLCMRLDTEIDGQRNSVYEVHTERTPRGPENPHGIAFSASASLLSREADAQQTVDPASARYWKIVNPSVSNALGDPVGYRLVPGANVSPFAHPDASLLERAAFLRKHLWVTPFDPKERYPAGDYPNQHRGGDGLPRWTEANRSVEDEDIVVWYTFGSHHIPRPEDWPVMPVERIGFALKPDGFFDRNPALDVPPAPAHCHD